MIWPFPGNIEITAGFDQLRPFDKQKKHKHGAIDIKTSVGSVVIAPENGKLIMYQAIRPQEELYWPKGELLNFPYRNYFYDMYGGLIVLKGQSGFTHVFAHIYMKQMHNNHHHEWAYVEEKKDARFPIFCWMAGEIKVNAGQKIGLTGNSGYSTGPHCHYEIHKGFKWQQHEIRPNPEKIKWDKLQ